MIEYGLSKHQLNELTKFSHIFNKDQNEFVLDCILTILCEWNEDKDKNRFDNGKHFSTDLTEVEFKIELPDDIEDELYELSDVYNLAIYDLISGIVGMILHYLDLNWSGEYGLKSDNMTSQEKVIELTSENEKDGDCWIEFFS
jgi:hypothetical protein